MARKHLDARYKIDSKLGTLKACSDIGVECHMRSLRVSFLITRYLSRRRLETYVSAHESCPVIQQCLQDCLQTWNRFSDETITCSSNGSMVCLPVEHLLNLFFNQCHPLIAYPRIQRMTIEYRFNYHS